MDPSKNNGNLRADFDRQDFGVSAERAADTNSGTEYSNSNSLSALRS
jgi:hypothetical protein